MPRYLSLLIALLLLPSCRHAEEPRPNFLFVITDDQSWLHAGPYGDTVVQTPALDQLAASGVVFEHAFTAAPSCTPSRSALLAGRHMWQVGTGGTLYGALEGQYPVFPQLLENAGYAIGYTGKTWGPGSLRPGGWERHPVGDSFEYFETDDHPAGVTSHDHARNFSAFLDSLDQEEPFFFWMGFLEPHRRFEEGSGIASGKNPEDVALPGIFPDLPEIRSDILDYYIEIEHIDSQLMQALATLKDRGLADNTVVVYTSDNGMPFPRAKTTLYDMGVRMPLIVSWPGQNRETRHLTDFVSLIDISPTFLEMAGIEPPETVTGQSLVPLLMSENDGRIDPKRDYVVAGVERHTLCRPEDATYPSRMLRTDDHLYIRNYTPDRWPAGLEDFVSIHQMIYGDIDNGITKSVMMDHRLDPKVVPFFELAFGRRPAQELYDVHADPWQLTNLAENPEHKATLDSLATALDTILRETGDPRMEGGDPWSEYVYYSGEFGTLPDKPVQ